MNIWITTGYLNLRFYELSPLPHAKATVCIVKLPFPQTGLSPLVLQVNYNIAPKSLNWTPHGCSHSPGWITRSPHAQFHPTRTESVLSRRWVGSSCNTVDCVPLLLPSVIGHKHFAISKSCIKTQMRYQISPSNPWIPEHHVAVWVFNHRQSELE